MWRSVASARGLLDHTAVAQGTKMIRFIPRWTTAVARASLLAMICVLAAAAPAAHAAQFRSVAPLPAPRETLAAVTLPSGKVLAMGGGSSFSRSDAYLYDPAVGTWQTVAPM